MTERKVINKYYPPDYDPSKIPKLKHREKEKNRLWSIRVMAPFNMRCDTCAEYIYKGKKFNSRKETVEDEDYLGLQIHRFYIRCPRCVAVIAFKTDPQNCDYTLEAGASRNFEAAKTAEALEKKAQQAREEEEANNPMKVLENRTKQSRLEMESIEMLEELRDTNAKHAKLDYEKLISDIKSNQELLRMRQEEQDEAEVQQLFGKQQTGVKRLYEIEVEESSDEELGAHSRPSSSQQKKVAPLATALNEGSCHLSTPKTPAAKPHPAVSSRQGHPTAAASKAARLGIVLKKPSASAALGPSAPCASASSGRAATEEKSQSQLSTAQPAEQLCIAQPEVEQQDQTAQSAPLAQQPAAATPCRAAVSSDSNTPQQPIVALVGQYSDSGSDNDS